MKKHVFILSLFVIVFAACSYHQGKERRNIAAPPKVHRKYERKCDEKKVVEKDKLQGTRKLQSLVEKDNNYYQTILLNKVFQRSIKNKPQQNEEHYSEIIQICHINMNERFL